MKPRLIHPPSAQGFTLIEVMVALMIVSMALPALIILVMTQLDGAAYQRDKTYGMWLAENQLTRINLLNNKELFPNYKLPEKDSGRLEAMGMQWQWRLEAKKAEELGVKGIVKLDMDIALLGIASGNGYAGTQALDNTAPIAHLTGYTSE